MKNLRHEIPALAYISAQIFQEAERIDTLHKAVRNVEDFYKMPTGSFRPRNPAYLLGLLYCLIVVPRELYLRANFHPFFDRVDRDLLLRLVSVTRRSPEFDTNPCYHLLRHLRNALSHVRFDIDETCNFTFWDQANDTAPEVFRATVTLPNMEILLSTIGAELANLCLPNPRINEHPKSIQ